MLNRLPALLVLIAISLGGASLHLAALNKKLVAELAAKKGESGRLKQDLSFLKSLPASRELVDLERSFVSLAAEISALKEIGGTAARASTDSSQAGEPVAKLAKKVAETEVSFMPVNIDIREYRLIDGIIEAIHSLSRRDILVNSISFDQGFSIKAELFGRLSHGQS